MLVAIFYLSTPIAALIALTNTSLDLTWWQEGFVFLGILTLPLVGRKLIQPSLSLQTRDNLDSQGRAIDRRYALSGSSLWYRFLPMASYVRSYSYPSESCISCITEWDTTRFTDRRPIEFLVKERGGNTIARPPGAAQAHAQLPVNKSFFLEVGLIFPFPNLVVWSRYYLVVNFGTEADSISISEWNKPWRWQQTITH